VLILAISIAYILVSKLVVWFFYRSALHWAAKRNQYPVVKLLLDEGADASLQTSNGKKADELTTDQKIIELLGETHGSACFNY